MNDRLVLQRLWWKELRQLLPLVLLLPALTLLLLGIYQLSDEMERATTAVIFIFGMPGLFAVGAGALLVGQEKELRTLQWLASLPIAAQRIVRVKLGAAVVGLALLWVLSILLLTTITGMDGRFAGLEIQWETWPINSLYVLLAGFALAWWANSALVALLLVVPVALIPLAIAYGIDSLIPAQQAVLDKPSRTTLLICQILCSAIVLWLADRLGQRNLAPATTGPATRSTRFPVWDRYRTGAQRAGYGNVQAPLPALIWQFVAQSRGVLIGTALMLAAAVALVAVMGGEGRPGVWFPLAILLAFLATSWLGVSVFQSDSVKSQIRFLADRGISPRAVWFTRHAAPASVLAVAIFAIVLVGLWSLGLRPSRMPAGSATVIFLYFLAVAVVYLVTQWLGQIILSPIVSAIAAPFVALAAIGYGSFAMQSLGTPWWLALLVLLIPPAATLTMTRRWMDRRLGLSYWASHGGFLTAALIIPAVPLLVAMVREPAMPAEVDRELSAVAQKNLSQLVTPHELVLGPAEPNDGFPERASEEPLVPLAVGWDQQLERIDEQLRGTTLPIGANSLRVIDRLKDIATLTRLAIGQDAGAASSSDAATGDAAESDRQTTLRLHRRSTELLVQIVQRMRLSPQLIDQDSADLLEIWLLTQLRRDGARQRLGDPLYEETAAVLADHQGRNAARIRAVALSWWRFEDQVQKARHPPTRLGGYDLQSLEAGIGTLRGQLLSKRRVGRAVHELWQLAQGGQRAATPQRLATIARFWGRPEGDYGLGPAGPYLRADDIDRFVAGQSVSRAVASQWFAGWEQQAAGLLEERSPREVAK